MTDSNRLPSIITALHSGNKSAFTELYQELKTPVYTIIYRVVQHEPTAEDIMQDVFVKLYQSPPPADVKNPRAWVFQMARNQALDGLRKKQADALPEDLTDSRYCLEDAVGYRLDIEAAIARLSPEEREIITLHLNLGLTFREIAGTVDRPMGTVLWKYQKAIGTLRRYLNGGST